MSVYKKIAQARNMLQEIDLKKSGHNKFANYHYFELGDFLPTCNMIFAELGLCDVISFTETLALMEIYDTESGEKAVFTSPMAMASLKGCHDVQNLGATQTYLRRYLWTTAMGIVEHDALDASKPVEEKTRGEICKETAKEHLGSIRAIKEHLADPTPDSVEFAREAFRELGEEVCTKLWVAPSKGGVFSTKEIKYLREGYSEH